MSSGILRIRSFCKINLALAVLRRREDGFHEIRTVLQAVDLHDDLEIGPAPGLAFRCEGLPGVDREQNLAWRAALELVRNYPVAAGAEIFLRKKIPPGSGLGGGSSNAAATLAGLCRLWGLEMPRETMQRMASRLGSDVPFFLEGGTALASGVGDRVEPLPDLPDTSLVVVFPGIAVSTAEAYRSLNLKLTSAEGVRNINRFCDGLARGTAGPEGIFNDFEASILAAYPVIREARDALIDQGATVVSLSGSGSSVFGFFRDEESALAASRSMGRETWRVFPAKTLSRAEYFRKMFG